MMRSDAIGRGELIRSGPDCQAGFGGADARSFPKFSPGTDVATSCPDQGMAREIAPEIFAAQVLEIASTRTWHVNCAYARSIECMATKVRMIKLLQEIRGLAQISQRRPPAKAPGLFLLQLRSHIHHTS